MRLPRRVGKESNEKEEMLQPVAQAVQTASSEPFAGLDACVSGRCERRLYAALRSSVPIVDAALNKIVRLLGRFEIDCGNREVSYQLNDFLMNVRVNATQIGIQNFLSSYLLQLLTYGNAIGEIVPYPDGQIAALYNASLDDVEMKPDGALNIAICRKEKEGLVPVPCPELVMVSALNPEPGQVQGTSILHGLPFVSNILLQIFHTIGVNWERLGNVRFAVTYKPGSDAAERAYAKERAQQIATEWGRAMRKHSVSDFIAVGDVSIKAIGADNQILDSEVPVRQMLEQIVAKLGIPPFLLGLSWSSTERMSSQQADILTSELESYRRLLNPVIHKICTMWLRCNGYERRFTINWNKMTLQDETELANARLLNARAAQIESALGEE